MNRRSFLASVSAAFSAAALGVNLKPRVPLIRYDLFTDAEIERYSIGEPFGVDGRVFATDSRVLVSHVGELIESDGERRLPNVRKLNWDEFDSPGWKPLGTPAYENQDDRRYPGTPCPDCMGIGLIGTQFTACDHCAGDGEVLSDDSIQIVQCSKCVGGRTGGIKCGRCDSGWIYDETFCEIVGGRKFAPHYMERIRTLGPIDVLSIDGRTADGSTGPMLLFRGDHGIRGMLMGVEF